MNTSKYKIATLEQEHLDYVLNNLSEATKKINSLMHDKEFFTEYLKLPNRLYAAFDDTPFIMFGWKEYPTYNWLWFTGTSEMKKHVKFLHMYSPGVFDLIKSDNKPLYARIPSQHTDIMNWCRHLGFVVHSTIGDEPNTYIILEYI